MVLKVSDTVSLLQQRAEGEMFYKVFLSEKGPKSEPNPDVPPYLAEVIIYFIINERYNPAGTFLQVLSGSVLQIMTQSHNIGLFRVPCFPAP
jgi:hypothetical protein